MQEFTATRASAQTLTGIVLHDLGGGTYTGPSLTNDTYVCVGDGAAFGPLTNSLVYAGGGVWSLTLTAAETDYAVITIAVSADEIEDADLFVSLSYATAGAIHFFF